MEYKAFGYQSRGRKLAMAVAVMLGVIAGIQPLSAQKIFKSVSGATSPDLSSVANVLPGNGLLLEQDDAAVAIVSNTNFYTTQLVPLHSSNSSFQQQPTVNTGLAALHPSAYASNSTISSSASGRMFNGGSDVVVTLSQNSGEGNAYSWAYSFWDSANGNTQGPYTLNQDTEPNGNPIYTKVVMGDFQGNNLQSALMFAESDFGSAVSWQMNIVGVVDVNQIDSIDPSGGGPVISAQVPPSQAPVSTTIAVGDFNQDGIDEIAILLRDGQTVQLYQVDPKTQQISLWQTIKLPAALKNPSLAAGRFNSSPNYVLAAVGQQLGSIDLTVDYIDPITNLSDPSVTIVPTTFGDSHLSGGVFERVFAQSAPLYNASANSLDQLVLGLAYEFDSWHALLIGTFGSDPNNPNNLFHFNLQESTGYNGCLIGMEIGNFNNQDGSGNLSPNLQIGLLKTFNGNSQCVPPFNNGPVYVEMRNITVPPSVSANPQAPVNNPADWLDTQLRTELVPNLGDYNAVTSLSFLIGDLQGRSERLGSPEHVTLTNHIQPNFILGMPPMHVDWIQPFGGTGESCEEGSLNPGPECVLNLDVTPNKVGADRSNAFSTTYSLTGTDVTTSTQQSTFSWTFNSKVTVGGTVSYKVPTSSASVSVAASVGAAAKRVSQKYASTYNSETKSLTTATGFDDDLFYTAETENYYVYPVLGNYSGSTEGPLYVTFSLPSSVQRGLTPGSVSDWYQPVHEPGNVLSYPWSMGELGQSFAPGTILPQASSGCFVTGQTRESNTVEWSAQQQQTASSGWANTFSENLNVSASYSAGVSFLGEGGKVKAFANVDIGSSQSWGGTTSSTNTQQSTQAVIVNTPLYGQTAANNYAYSFENYVFGTTNALPPTQSSASFLPSNLDVPPFTGPLFVGFTADPTTECSENGATFWTDAYSQPDVGFNHPNRWKVDSTNVATFSNALIPNPDDTCLVVPSADCPLISRSFFRMKGLLITTGAAPDGKTSISGTVTSVPAGRSIYLTARVYNFSLVATNQTVASTVHVRFYGQKRCQVNYGGTVVTDLCPNGAFQIAGNGRDGDVVLASIPGFNGPSQEPNWKLASVKFDTTGFDDTELVFWVVTWIEDANGNVLSETPDHGVKLASFVGKTFQNITDVPLDAHSNNIGFYGANHSPFYVAPAASPSSSAAAASLPGAEAPAKGPLQSIKLKLRSRKFRVDQETYFVARFSASPEMEFPGSTVLYYDGDPARGGKLFDLQTIHALSAGKSAEHLINFRAQRCGEHTIYAISERESLPTRIGSVTANVTISPVKEVRSMTTYVQGLDLAPRLKRALLDNLSTTEKRFAEGNKEAGLETLRSFLYMVREIPFASQHRLDKQAVVLRGDAELIRSCESD